MGRLVSSVRVVLAFMLLFSSIAMNSVREGTALIARAASTSATIAISPQHNVVAFGNNVTISVNVTNVPDLFLWQVVLKYNSTVLNLTDVWIPEDNVFANLTQITPDPVFGKDSVDGLDYVVFGSSLMDFETASVAAGVLFRANMTGLKNGQTPVEIATEANPANLEHASYYSFIEDSDLAEMSFEEESGDAVVGPVAFLTLTSTVGGMIDPAPGTYLFMNDSHVLVTASAYLGYDFSHWEFDSVNVGLANPYNITMDINHTLQAVFLVHIPVTWTVDMNGGADFRSIQEAINSSLVAYNDIILVKPGVYYENVDMTKKVTLTGEDEDTTIIDGNGTGTIVTVFGNFTNFTVRNGEYGVAIKNDLVANDSEGNTLVYGNRIINNNIGGVILGGSPLSGAFNLMNSTLSNNYIANNTLYGVNIWSATNVTVINNVVENNEHGIDFYGGCYNDTLRNNQMNANKYNFGVILRGDTLEWMTSVSSPNWFWNNDVDASNKVDDKPIYFWANRQDAQVPPDAGYVLLYDCSNITISNCSLSHNLEGILVLNTSSSMIADNKISDNVYGIYIAMKSSNNSLIQNDLLDNLNGVYLGTLSRYTTMRNNSISGGLKNFGIYPQAQYSYWDIQTDIYHDLDRSDLANDVDSTNTVDGKPIIYWFNQRDVQVPANAGFAMLVNCSNILVEGLNLTDNVENLLIIASNNTSIRNNFIANSIYGVEAEDFSRWSPDNFSISYPCFNITVSGNTFVNNSVGILLRQADESTASNNTLQNNPLGILLRYTSNSTVSENLINASAMPDAYPDSNLYVFYYPDYPWEGSPEVLTLEIGGIYIGGSYNAIYDNTVANSTYGIFLADLTANAHGSYNVIFHNNFINNNVQAIGSLFSGSNQWDNGYPAGGNYWSDSNKTDLYSGPQQNINGSDGICDSAHMIIRGIGSFEYDRYPLTVPVNVFDVAVWNNKDLAIDVQSNSTISAFTFSGSSKASVSFNVTGPRGTTGFCRVTIPKELLWISGGQWLVLVNGTQVACNITEDADYTYFQFNYNHSTETVEIVGTAAIPEFPPNMILAIFMILTLLTALILKKSKTLD